MTTPAAGTIITFYSYKGGTGRTMLLANVAWILASAGKRVLVIDWDLEAPGLHRYFRPFLADKDCTQSEGLIDLVLNYADAALTPGESGGDWYRQYADIFQYAVSLDWTFPQSGTLDIVAAGRQDGHYASRVNMFNWGAFYERLGGGAFLEAVKGKLRQEYDYVLIDGRTGISDTGGIVTMQMPDCIVACFSYGHDSVHGIAEVLRSAAKHRATSGDRPLMIFPVAMRVEKADRSKLQELQNMAMSRMRPLVSMDDATFERYWLEVENVYVPAYTYGEYLTAFADDPSALSSAISLTSYLTDGDVRAVAPMPESLRRSIIERFNT